LNEIAPPRQLNRSAATSYRMTSLVPQLFAAVLALSIAFLSFGSCRQSREQTAATAPTPGDATDFVGTGAIDDFKEYYRRPSDGAIVRYGCYDRDSDDTALKIIRSQREARVIEKTVVSDATGVKIGERIVWNATSLDDAAIYWNQGARLFSIQARSLTDALTFEKSRVWVGASCEDMRSFDQRRHRTNRWTRAEPAGLVSTAYF
jgi:hypothetical protein